MFAYYINRSKLRFDRLRTSLLYRHKLGSLGKGCVLDIKRLIGGKYIFIGDYVTIYWGARLESITNYCDQIYNPKIVIGNNVAIGQNSHIISCGSVIISDRCTITSNVTIVDMIHPYEEIDISPRYAKALCNPVDIGKDCFINNGAVILPGTHLGIHCIVGANSVVHGHFGDYQVLAGAPARIVKHYDLELQGWVKG